jgi:hypothetical protein
MKTFVSDDDETPIEELPGYVGHTWDGEFCPGPELELLGSFDWDAYRELIDETNRPRRLALVLAGGTLGMSVDAYDGIASLLDQCPSVDAWLDEGPPDPGPASGSGCIFTIADGATFEQLEHEMGILRAALDTDLLKLSTPGATVGG